MPNYQKTSKFTETYLLEKARVLLMPNLSVDCVIFCFHNNKLRVLLLKWKDTKNWSLPGDFIFKNEHIEEAAHRTLREKTGLKNINLRQFHTFGDPRRTKKSRNVLSEENGNIPDWLSQRFVTIGYLAMVKFSAVIQFPNNSSFHCEWCDTDKIPKLIIDHGLIYAKAFETLAKNINDYDVCRDLLPAKFTMSELFRLHETILHKKLDRRNFQKRMCQLGMVKRLKERKMGCAHKLPFLYCLKSICLTS